jgi:hypothetical protein
LKGSLAFALPSSNTKPCCVNCIAACAAVKGTSRYLAEALLLAARLSPLGLTAELELEAVTAPV